MVAPIIVDMRKIKYELVQAYCVVILEDAEKETGKICVKNYDLVRNTMMEIIESVKKDGNDYDSIVNRLRTSGKNPLTIKIMNSYTKIGQVVKKYFKVGCNNWIPSLLVLNLLYEYQLRGYANFKHIDFLSLIAEYEKFEEKTDLKTHFKCAEEILRKI